MEWFELVGAFDGLVTSHCISGGSDGIRGSRGSVLGQIWSEGIREARVSEAVPTRVFPTDLCHVLWKKGFKPFSVMSPWLKVLEGHN